MREIQMIIAKNLEKSSTVRQGASVESLLSGLSVPGSAGPAAGYITGQVLTVDGGMVM